jgi:hypothetical protein
LVSGGVVFAADPGVADGVGCGVAGCGWPALVSGVVCFGACPGIGVAGVGEGVGDG